MRLTLQATGIQLLHLGAPNVLLLKDRTVISTLLGH